MDEIWKPIPGFEKYYEASNLGNIRRIPSKRLRRIDYAPIYPTILLSTDGLHKTYRVHRLIAETFLPKIEGKTHVNHKDGNHKNNTVENLEWVTQKKNNQHSYYILQNRTLVRPDDTLTMKQLKAYCRKFGISDIRMRQLNVNELKRIMGFPENYILVGTQCEQKKFIGNAVEVNMSRCLCESLYKGLQTTA